jgi:hypothetical protein
MQPLRMQQLGPASSDYVLLNSNHVSHGRRMCMYRIVTIRNHPYPAISRVYLLRP